LCTFPVDDFEVLLGESFLNTVPPILSILHYTRRPYSYPVYDHRDRTKKRRTPYTIAHKDRIQRDRIQRDRIQRRGKSKRRKKRRVPKQNNARNYGSATSSTGSTSPSATRTATTTMSITATRTTIGQRKSGTAEKKNSTNWIRLFLGLRNQQRGQQQQQQQRRRQCECQCFCQRRRLQRQRQCLRRHERTTTTTQPTTRGTGTMQTQRTITSRCPWAFSSAPLRKPTTKTWCVLRLLRSPP